MSHNYEVLNIVTEYFTSLNRLRDLKSNGTPKTPVNIKRDRSSIDDMLKIQLGNLGYNGNTFVTNYNLSIAEHNKVDSNFQMGERMKHTTIANGYLTDAAGAIGLTLQDIHNVKLNMMGLSTQPPARNFGGPKQIFVKRFNNMIFTIYITPDETVASLKTQIFNQEGIPIELQELRFAGKLLENDRSLESYNILPLTTIHLLIGGDRNLGKIMNGSRNKPSRKYKSRRNRKTRKSRK
jgi:ubiquitin C